jgi:hypothetical protein
MNLAGLGYTPYRFNSKIFVFPKNSLYLPKDKNKGKLKEIF